MLKHESRCKHIHGHTYKAEVTVQANGLDRLGRVVDFSVIKEKVGTWIDEQWDHNIILHPEDPMVELWKAITNKDSIVAGLPIFGNKAPYIMPGYCPNPTAENLARVLAHQADALLNPSFPGLQLYVRHVRLWETPACFADFYPGEHR